MEEKIYGRLLKNGQIPFTYEINFNGSYGSIAGVCDETGLILGMMPHPEANLMKVQTGYSYDNMFNPSNGQEVFQSIIHYMQ